MNGISPQRYFREPAKVAAGTSFVEGLAGVGAIALAIIGLAQVYPVVLASVATIVLGSALVFESGAVGARFSSLRETTTLSYWGGIATNFVCGVGGIALGIIAVVGVKPMVLVPIAAIAFGFALIVDSTINARLNTLESQVASESFSESTASPYGIETLAGLGAIALGILALVGISPLMLSLISMLAVGAAILLAGTVVGGRMLSIFKRQEV